MPFVSCVQKVFNDAIKKLSSQAGLPVMEQNFCTLLNISVCSYTETMNKVSLTTTNKQKHTKTT
jgi:hypothetical protein